MKKRINKIASWHSDQFRKVLSTMLSDCHPVYMFSFLLLFAIFWGSYIPSLKFNYDIERFFSTEDPEVAYYDAHKSIFENENHVVLIGLLNKGGVFQETFLKKIDSLSNTLERFPYVKKVFSPTNLYESIKSPMGAFRVPLISVYQPDKYNRDKLKIYQAGIYTNSFFSVDTQSVSILVRTQGGLSRKTNDSLLHTLENVVSSFGFDAFHIAGRIRTQHYYASRMKNQMGLFAGLASILFLVSLYVIFRNTKHVMIALGSVLISLVWIFGIIGYLGVHLDLMLTLLPSLVFIISTSNSIHLITRFKNEYVEGISKKEAIKTALKETGLPNFLNAFTTAIGFASLVMIPVAPIQQFGLFSAVGILISFLVGLLFIPASLMVLRLKPSEKSPPVFSRDNRFFKNILKKSRLITGVTAIFIITSIFFAVQIKINNHFLDDLNSTSSLKKDLDFFEQNFAGIRPFELNIQALNPLGDGSILSHKALIELDLLETYLTEEYQVGFIFSPLNLIKSVNKAINHGDHNFYKIPDSQNALDKVLKIANKQRLWNRFQPVLNNNHSIGRISGRTKDEGSLVFHKKNEALQAFLKNHVHLLVKQTGAAHLMDNASSHIAWNLTKGMLLAVLIATLVIGLFTRSWKLALISLVPNTLPLLMVAGFMGATGIPLKVTTALIFIIAYGIAVDDTIHFLNNYRLNKKIFDNNNDALQQTITTMWRPMLYTSLVLFSGFMIFTLSEFSSISTLGYLVSGSLVMALLADLFFLPVILKNKK